MFKRKLKRFLKSKGKSEMSEKKFEVLVQIRAALTQQDIDVLLVLMKR